MKDSINLGEAFYEKSSLDYVGNFYSLSDVFGSYSRTKEAIYISYYALLCKNCDEVINYGIRSASRFLITLEADVMKDGIRYYLVI